MFKRMMKILSCNKYGIPAEGTMTGAELANILEEHEAPAEAVEAFKRYVVSVRLHTPKRIVINFWN